MSSRFLIQALLPPLRRADCSSCQYIMRSSIVGQPFLAVLSCASFFRVGASARHLVEKDRAKKLRAQQSCCSARQHPCWRAWQIKKFDGRAVAFAGDVAGKKIEGATIGLGCCAL
jgi:hypothetical protein